MLVVHRRRPRDPAVARRKATMPSTTGSHRESLSLTLSPWAPHAMHSMRQCLARPLICRGQKRCRLTLAAFRELSPSLAPKLTITEKVPLKVAGAIARATARSKSMKKTTRMTITRQEIAETVPAGESNPWIKAMQKPPDTPDTRVADSHRIAVAPQSQSRIDMPITLLATATADLPCQLVKAATLLRADLVNFQSPRSTRTTRTRTRITPHIKPPSRAKNTPRTLDGVWLPLLYSISYSFYFVSQFTTWPWP